MNEIWIAAASNAFLASPPVLAHPGHGTNGSWHYFTEVEHLAALVCVTALLAVAIGLLSLRSLTRPTKADLHAEVVARRVKK